MHDFHHSEVAVVSCFMGSKMFVAK
jgi:hypothetical protein